MKEVINSLDVHAKSAIALIFMRGGRLESPCDLTDFDQNAIMTLGSEQSQLAGALESLKDSLIVQEYFDGQMYWKYKHPTIKDAFSSIVADNSEYLDIYLKGAPIEQIMKEVSCGADVQGAKIIVSANRYEKIIHKMDFSSASSWEQRSLLHYFLAERCGKVFLEKFLAFNTWYLNGLTVWSYLSISTEIDVLARLKSLDLLPEDVRLKTVQQISDLAVDMPDAGFLKGNARNLLDEDEVQTILGRVKNELLPDLHCLVDNLASDYDSEESPDSHFAFLLEALKDYQSYFEGECAQKDLDYEGLLENEVSLDDLQAAICQINDLITRFDVDYERRNDDESFFSDSSQATTPVLPAERSIFDDVDA